MEWIKFKLIERPYYNPITGGVLTSIKGLRNRPNIDPFTGGGKVYPDLSKVKVLERYEKGVNLMVLVEGEQSAIDDLLKQGAVTFRASPKELKTESLGFQPKVKTDIEATVEKETVFGIIKSIESGVTE